MSGYRSDVLAVVGGIQEILLAVDGPTVVREIVQNADDAKAERLVFEIIDEGLKDVDNSLLKGPALLAVNDGAFSARNHNAIRKTRGGPKTGDTETIGRFGIGLKSVYYLCESLIYIGAENGTTRADALDPWADGDCDPLHKDWNTVTDRDKCRLSAKASALLSGCFDNGLLLWIPLRSPAHANRGPCGSELGLSTYYPETKHVRDCFREPATLALLLSQCGYLQSINAVTAKEPGSLKDPVSLGGVSRPSVQPGGWLGRYKPNTERPKRSYFGEIESTGSRDNRWFVSGIEALGLRSLSDISGHEDWPEVLKEDSDGGGTFKKGPREALAHAAVTVLHQRNQERAGVRIRWAVYLPLDDVLQPERSPLGAGGSDSWDIVMHGAFWPDQDRRSIPGATGTDDDGAGSVEAVMRSRWNRTLRDELLLPLLPQALELATRRVSEVAASTLIEHVWRCSWDDTHRRAITSSHMLLPVITKKGLQWRKFTKGTCFYAVPSWKQAPSSVCREFGESITVGESIFIADDAPRVGGKPSAWPVDQVQLLLECISCETLGTREGLDWTAGFVRYVLSRDGVDRRRSVTAASWLGKRVGDGALTAAIDRRHVEQRQMLQQAWWRLYYELPHEWHIDAPEDGAPAVVEIARDGIVGEGLLPISLDRRTNPLPPRRQPSQPNAERLDNALRLLGSCLSDQDATNWSAYRARLLLSDALLRVRDGDGFDDELAEVPVLRVLRLPENRDEAWSLIDLRGAVEQHRVFVGEGDRSRRAVGDLSSALGEPAYLVSRVLARYAGVQPVTPDAFACSVLTLNTIESAPIRRIPLLEFLGGKYTEPVVGRAMRMLLTGEHKAACDARRRLYYVPDDDQHETKRATLRILLRLRDERWRAVGADLIGQLANDTLCQLNVQAAEYDVLLRRETLAVPDWSQVEHEEVLHLLRHLYSTTTDGRGHWEKMPLHRGTDGRRGCIDDRARVVEAELAENQINEIQERFQIRLITPDDNVRELYHYVDRLDNDGFLRALLTIERPHLRAKEILSRLGDPLPSGEISELLKEKPWLPASGGDYGIAPAEVIDLPGEFLKRVRPLSVALQSCHLADEVCRAVWADAQNVVHGLLGEPSRRQQLERLTGALDPASVATVDDGAYVILPCGTDIDSELIGGAMSTQLASQHRGWEVVGSTWGYNNVDAALAVARALRGPVPSRYQTAMLNAAAADTPAVGEPACRFYVFLVRSFARTPEFKSVLGEIKLPTQDGWSPSCKVAKSTFGVARRHRVVEELRDALGVAGEPGGANVPGAVAGEAGAAVDILRDYFDSWRAHVPPTPVGAFLSILGNAVSDLALSWLQNDTTVGQVRRELMEPGGTDPWLGLDDVSISQIDGNGIVHRENVLGELVGMIADPDNDTIFADLKFRRYAFPNYHAPQLTYPERTSSKIVLRTIVAQDRTPYDLIGLLRSTAEQWAVKVLRLNHERVQAWWQQWQSDSPVHVTPVRASILAHLPLTLRQLGVRECAALQDALNRTERAQRRREQAVGDDIGRAIRYERDKLKKLGNLIPEHSGFLRKRIRRSMRLSGYAPESVLLELVQNADDALAQASDVAPQPLSEKSRTVVIRIHEVDDGQPTIDFMHFGRPINDTGGVQDGIDRQWDQDLYFMMLPNLSAKPGEVPQGDARSSTTGRFGLGFKSIHLISDSPSVVSNYLAFRIVGGLLPEEDRTVNLNESDLQEDGRRATRIRLPLRSEVCVDQLFSRFHSIRSILPAFARGLCRVVVDRGGHKEVGIFDGDPVPGAPDWSISRAESMLSDNKSWRLLRFRPGPGTATLLVGLRNGMPAPLPDVPFLWNVTPIADERWGCGYAISGPFKLDHGRTRVSLDDKDTRAVVDHLGTALGEGLVTLQDALDGDGDRPDGLPIDPTEIAKFIAELWTVLASGIDDRDKVELHQAFLQRLHRGDRGISRWMSARSVVRTELPNPFQAQLPALSPNARIERVEGGLDSQELCDAIAQVSDLACIVKSRLSVSGSVAHRLQSLGIRWRRLQPSDLFRELAEHWGQRLTPERLHALRPLAQDTVWKILEQQPGWHSNFRACSVAGEDVPLQNLLLPVEASSLADSSAADELLRAKFAPDDVVLGPGYICTHYCPVERALCDCN